MRTLLIIFSIGLLCTLVQYSSGKPIQASPSSSEEDDDVESMQNNNYEISSNTNDESDETMPSSQSDIDPVDDSEPQATGLHFFEAVEQLKEQNSNSNEDDSINSDEDRSSSFNAANNNYGIVLEDSDEK
ncbi:unnamed protein product [Adineta steineri]|uniref:Uncharacterized protein n=1 Tax=Adineta steineri TaxID=433720 RepID=A0A819ELK0_9BILA|nr:unnamed protein product [Adineta steineri]CAF3852775.1 unnamed protein product [Adineta steineri]